MEERFPDGLSGIEPFIVGLGLAHFGIACAGVRFKLFAAPAEEPITGNFADYPWLEAIAMSALFALVGVGAILLPWAGNGFAYNSKLNWKQKTIGWVWGLTGIGLLIFGAMNFFTHIGLIINTMG